MLLTMIPTSLSILIEFCCSKRMKRPIFRMRMPFEIEISPPRFQRFFKPFFLYLKQEYTRLNHS